MRKLIGIDTETVRHKGIYDFYSFQAFSDDVPLRVFSPRPDEAVNFFTHKTRNSILLAHNAEYDLAVLRKILPTPPFLFKVAYNKSRFVFAKIFKEKDAWSIFDTKNLFPNMSLKKVGEIIGCLKLDPPPYLGNREPQSLKENIYFIKYAMRDAEICYRAGCYIRDNFGIMRPTLPSLSYSVYRKQYAPRGIFLTAKDTKDLKLRYAYKGGRSEVFIRGSPPEPIKVWDANSLYPYVMGKNEYPLVFGDLKHKTNLDLSHEGIAHVLLEHDTEIPFMPVKSLCKDGVFRLMFPVGKIKGWFTYPELRRMEFGDHGKILKVYEVFETPNHADIFSKFIDYYFKKKEVATQDKEFWKTFLNSLYGKFAQKPISPMLELERSGKLTKLLGLEKDLKIGSTNVMIAAYITAYARIEMLKHYRKVGLNHLCYTDTDSVHAFNCSLACGNKLGDLKLVSQTSDPNKATYVRSKFYLLNDVLKCKGLQRILKADEMRKLIEQNNVWAMTTILLRIKAAYFRHKELLTEIDEMKRFTLDPDLKRIYDKDVMGGDLLTNYSTSKAVVLNDVV